MKKERPKTKFREKSQLVIREARIRTVKPELFNHEELFDAEKASGLPLRLAFIALFSCCDKEGRFRWEPRRLKLHMLPYDEINISQVLEAFVIYGFILKYHCNGKFYGCIPSWGRHQKMGNGESESLCPPPEDLVLPESLESFVALKSKNSSINAVKPAEIHSCNTGKLPVLNHEICMCNTCKLQKLDGEICTHNRDKLPELDPKICLHNTEKLSSLHDHFTDDAENKSKEKGVDLTENKLSKRLERESDLREKNQEKLEIPFSRESKNPNINNKIQVDVATEKNVFETANLAVSKHEIDVSKTDKLAIQNHDFKKHLVREGKVREVKVSEDKGSAGKI